MDNAGARKRTLTTAIAAAIAATVGLGMVPAGCHWAYADDGLAAEADNEKNRLEIKNVWLDDEGAREARLDADHMATVPNVDTKGALSFDPSGGAHESCDVILDGDIASLVAWSATQSHSLDIGFTAEGNLTVSANLHMSVAGKSWDFRGIEGTVDFSLTF